MLKNERPDTEPQRDEALTSDPVPNGYGSGNSVKRLESNSEPFLFLDVHP
jgi:hypothetical protein